AAIGRDHPNPCPLRVGYGGFEQRPGVQRGRVRLQIGVRNPVGHQVAGHVQHRFGPRSLDQAQDCQETDETGEHVLLGARQATPRPEPSDYLPAANFMPAWTCSMASLIESKALPRCPPLSGTAFFSSAWASLKSLSEASMCGCAASNC